MNKDWIYADGENINIHHDLMPKIIEKFGAGAVIMVATVVARNGKVKEKALLELSPDEDKSNKKIIDELLENKIFEKVGEDIRLVEGAFDKLIES